MSASAMATELGDRIKQEGDKLRKLELVGHAAQMVHTTKKDKKKAKGKKRSKLGLLTWAVMIGGVAYGIYKMLREERTDDMPVAAREPYTTESAVADKPTVRSA